MKLVEKHALWLRLNHWFNVPLLGLMIWSGLLIYWANGVYWPFFPDWFYESLALKHQLSDGLSVHFAVGWLFIGNGLLYLLFLAVSGHWRELFPNRQTPKWVLPTILHDLGLRHQPLPAEKFNAMQRLAYTSAIGIGVLVVLSGFAIYKPVQLSWLTTLFGGYKGARLVHFVMMLSLCAFTAVHVLQVLRAGWNNFRAMVAGFEVERE